MILINQRNLANLHFQGHPMIGALNGGAFSPCFGGDTFKLNSTHTQSALDPEKSVHFSVDLPGVKPTDVQLRVIPTRHTHVSILSLDAERDIGHPASKRSLNQQWFLRHKDLNLSDILHATLVDGVLTLEIPKKVYKKVNIPISNGPVPTDENNAFAAFLSLDVPGMNSSTVQQLVYDEQLQKILVSGNVTRGARTTTVNRQFRVTDDHHASVLVEGQETTGYLVDGVLTLCGRISKPMRASTNTPTIIPVLGREHCAVNSQNSVEINVKSEGEGQQMRPDNWVDVETDTQDHCNVETVTENDCDGDDTSQKIG